MTETTNRPRRRADAQRSIDRIVAAARSTLGDDPDATIDDIATAAGVGRMTLYGHFKNRADLVEAALTEALRAGDERLEAVDLSGDPRDALSRLLVSSWTLVAESNALLEAAQSILPTERVRQMHAAPAERIAALIRRGQDRGVFRTDLPNTWLINAVFYLIHGAADENRAGRLADAEAADVITATVRSMLAVPPN